MSFRCLPVATVLLAATHLFAASAKDLPSESDRLLATARLWATVNYFHPYLAYRNIDWDGALIEALPRIRTATTPREYESALRGMLDRLHHGASFISDDDSRPDSNRNSASTQGPQRTWVHYGVHPAFLIADRSVPPLILSMGAGITATLQLSEPATGNIPALSDAKKSPSGPEAPYPSVEYRILAAYKLWATVRNFFAYRDLMDSDWDQHFADFLPKFIEAKNEREYNLAAAAALTQIDDTNATIRSEDLDRYFGVSPVGLRIRLVERKPVVTAILDDEATTSGVRVGDIVTSVDGEEIVARIHREIEYIPASTNQSLSIEVCKRLLNGAEGSPAVLTLQTANSETRQVTLHRSARFAALLSTQRSGEALRYLSKAIGYVDLEKMNAADVDTILEKFGKMTAIVFDLRGSVNVEPTQLASRLTAKSDSAGAIVTGPIDLTPDLPTSHSLTETASFFRVETFPGNATPYAGKTVALIDERTIGRAEHLGLLMEAANNTTFVGSPSAGADGEVTEFPLPGGITITFSTTDVRHGNGGKLQRLGLQPAELVNTTVHSIRAGTDEALEKAIESISR
jgi:C-terminal processing protease CtpA/Prc